MWLGLPGKTNRKGIERKEWGLGNAGAVITNDDEFAKMFGSSGGYGSDVKYFNLSMGFNARLDELQAAFFRVKLKVLDKGNANRTRIAEIYQSRLSGISGLTFLHIPVWAESVWHQFVIRTQYCSDV